MEINFKTRVTELQNELKAPKNLYNSFGKYKYRNLESICEAVKPLLTKYGMTMTISDEMRQIGTLNYIFATATLSDIDTTESVSVTGCARESYDKKGMDGSQVTGAASSYARKYAVNGLLLIDDTKDPDSDEYKKQQESDRQDEADQKKYDENLAEKISISDAVTVKNLIVRYNINEEKLLKQYEIAQISDMTGAMVAKFNNQLAKAEHENAKKRDSKISG